MVLNLLQLQPLLVQAAIVSRASIHPPDDKAHWEMPHMATDQAWINVMTEDVGLMGMENAQGIQTASFEFSFAPKAALPPLLVVVGENNIAMAKWDFEAGQQPQ